MSGWDERVGECRYYAARVMSKWNTVSELADAVLGDERIKEGEAASPWAQTARRVLDLCMRFMEQSSAMAGAYLTTDDARTMAMHPTMCIMDGAIDVLIKEING